MSDAADLLVLVLMLLIVLVLDSVRYDYEHVQEQEWDGTLAARAFPAIIPPFPADRLLPCPSF